ncbi:ankyrin repeat and SOCS box protein 13 [Nematostella vectensis]|uniref:ankyrin repeat and SOCS box protein 13 n=1 Tax=Nematostella vectensis TaxID=45351 RepID=UPI00207765D2|nr:ankyrin repeat and SOCS box protein 13 [Nematostella vectensis]
MDPNEALLQMIREGNGCPESFHKLLNQEGISVNYSNPGNFETPLHLAAIRGNDTAIKVLLMHGACINARSADMMTPLHEASLAGHVRCVEILIGAGADVNICNIDGSTPLCFASCRGCLKTVQLLLNMGADVNSELSTAFPPLHEAVLQGHAHCVDLLVRYGAGVDKCENQYGTVLHIACLKNYCRCTRILLLAGANPNTIRHHLSPLHLAAKHGCKMCITLLVKFGADLHKRDVEGRRAVDITTDETCKAFLLNAMEIPWTLLHCSRIAAWRAMIPQYHRKINELPIPRILKNYLNFSEFDSL